MDPRVSPATFGANQKSEGRSSVVTALMESVIKELKNDIQESQFDEKTAHNDYEKLMKEKADDNVINDKHASMMTQDGNTRRMTNETVGNKDIHCASII